MKKRPLLSLAVICLSLSNGLSLFAQQAIPPEAGAISAETNPSGAALNADLTDLVTRVNEKLKQGKTTEADLANNLKEFDALVAKYTNAPAMDRAHVLVMKAQLYLQVLDQPEKALEIFKQIKKNYPTARINGNTDDLINTLQQAVERKQSREALVPGAAFPDFDEKDVDGKPLSISKYKGKIVLVDFWATWCPPCVAELPQIQQAYDKFHGKGFEIVGVSLDEDKDKLQLFVRQRKMPWPQFFDGKRWENKLAVKYGVDQTPTGYLLNRQGKIIAKLASADELDAQVARALAE